MKKTKNQEKDVWKIVCRSSCYYGYDTNRSKTGKVIWKPTHNKFGSGSDRGYRCQAALECMMSINCHAHNCLVAVRLKPLKSRLTSQAIKAHLEKMNTWNKNHPRPNVTSIGVQNQGRWEWDRNTESAEVNSQPQQLQSIPSGIIHFPWQLKGPWPKPVTKNNWTTPPKVHVLPPYKFKIKKEQKVHMK